jgi:ribosomal protein S18 acetylase RimI-like enzyme
MINEPTNACARTNTHFLTLTNTSLTLRAATTEDEPLLFEIYASTRLPELAFVPWDDNQKLAFMKMQFDVRQQQYRNAYRDAISSIILQQGQPIGALLVEIREDAIALIDIALLPAHRNSGVGGQVVRALMDEAKVAGKMIRLYVFGTSAAVRFYERLGFRKVSDDGAYLEMTWQPSQ